MAEYKINKLHACLDKETQIVFFASMISRRGSLVDMRSSSPVRKGTLLVLMPIEEDWDGKPIQSFQITQSPHGFEATVHRIGGRGEFQLRLLSEAEQNFMSRFKAAQMGIAQIEAEVSRAGLVSTLRLTGQLGVEAVGLVQTELRKISERLVLIDLSPLESVNRAALAMLTILMKEEKPHRHFALLTQSNSEIEEILSDSKITTVSQVFTNRESAVTYLLQEDLD
ncbi:MAG: hypothetical protein RBU29_02685 [bacterium]|nr:hypothetical protein [bacterium]